MLRANKKIFFLFKLKYLLHQYLPLIFIISTNQSQIHPKKAVKRKNHADQTKNILTLVIFKNYLSCFSSEIISMVVNYSKIINTKNLNVMYSL